MKWLIGIAALGCMPSLAMAVPAGKGLATVDTLYFGPTLGISGRRLDVGEDGIPILFGVERGPGYGDVQRLDWADSVWTPSWLLGQYTIYLWPALADDPSEPLLVWEGASLPTGVEDRGLI